MANLRYLYHSIRLSPRQTYWNIAADRERVAKLQRPEFAALSRHVASEAQHLSDGLAGPAAGSDDGARLRAAVDWVLRAQRSTPDNGVSLGYFPLDTPGGWRQSYPETTGYLITSLLDYASHAGRDDVRQAALEMAHWEADVQMRSGAVQGGPVAPPERQTAAAFNTGMVLDGWCSAYTATKEQRLADAALAAARFLANDMDAQGYFKTNGDFVSRGETKTYNVLCAWAMLRLGHIVSDETLKRAAVTAVEAALRRQRGNGWFANNCLTMSAIPLTHTIGYTLQGVFEVGVLAERPDFVAAAELGLTNVLRRTRPNGFLAARFDASWRPASDYVCLTGSCQLAVIAYRFAKLFGKRDFVPTADRLVSFVSATQRLSGDDPGTVGGIAGSYPILGDYMTGGYPNWATKYFIDALLRRSEVH